MGRRSRKPRPLAEAAPGADERLRRGYARGAARDEAARAALVPLTPGERPAALVAGATVAGALGVGNFVAYVAGLEVEGKRPAIFGVLLLCALLLAVAVGMWRRRYWAVISFEALLGITLVFTALALLVAGNLLAVLVCVVMLGLGGWLFWRLVRVMARLQAPQRDR